MYPTLAPPQVMVTCNYVGANADTVEKAVTIPLEESINGVEGMRYISSSSTNSGTSKITATFQTGYDLDIAAVDVQNRVASAQGRLPAAVNATGITITKSNSTLSSARASIPTMGATRREFISNYLDVYVKDALKRVPGVGDVMIFGERKYAMRVWLDPVRLAARGLTATDVVNALVGAERRNSRRPARAAAVGRKQAFQIPVRVVGRLTSPAEFDNIIVKNSANGLVQLKDVGHSEVGAEDYSSSLKYSGHDAIGIGVKQLSNANALDVDRRRRPRLKELSKSFPPGLKYAIAFDSTTVVGDSIHEVLVTLAEAIVIVIVGDLPVPAGLARDDHSGGDDSGFADRHIRVHQVFGFSINSLTLFGITLATGLVVDDAIVVIENVQRHIAMEHSDPHEATSRAMGEVTSAVIATSLVLIAVFVPVSFFPGTTGILYRQFSLTIAFSIAISAFNALTLSPALSAMFLRGEEDAAQATGLSAHPACLARLCRLHPRRRCVCHLDGKHVRQDHPCRAAAAVSVAAGLLCRSRAQRCGCTACSHRLYSAGGPGLPDGDCAGAAGLVAGVYHGAGRPRAGHHRTESGYWRRVLRHGLQFFRRRIERRHDVCHHQASDQRRGKGHSTADIVADLSPKLQMPDVCAQRRTGGDV